VQFKFKLCLFYFFLNRLEIIGKLKKLLVMMVKGLDLSASMAIHIEHFSINKFITTVKSPSLFNKTS